MPFQIQGNSGKIYDFEDDVPLEKAAEFINLKEPPKSWTDIPEMGLGLAKGNWTQAAAGLAQVYGDVMPGFLGSETALEDAARLREQARQESEQAVGGATPLQRDVAGGVASVIQNIPTIALGTTRGLVGLASGMGAKEAAIAGGEAALRGMVGPEVAGEYSAQREAGMGGLRSALHAGVHGVAEYVPERLAFTPLVNLLSLGKGPTLSAIGSFLGRDLIGEEATTVMEFVNQKLSRRPDATLGDLLDEIKSTAVSTLVSGPLQAGFGAGVAAAAMPVARRVAPKELPPGNIPYSSQDLIPATVPPTTTAEPSATFTAEPQVVEPKVTLGSYTNARLAEAQIAPTEISPADAAIFRDVPALEPDASLNEALGANFEPRTYDASLDAIYRTYPHAENARATPVLASTDSSITPGSIVTDFNALPEGSVTIIGSQEMTPLQQARLHPIMRQIHAWAQEFLPDKRFVLSTSAFSYGNPAFDRPFHTVLGDNTSGFFFASNEGVSALETQFRDITNIGHEFTHAVTEYRLADAAPDMRQRIFNGFVEWRNRAGTTPASKWFAEGMTAKRYASLMAEAKVRGIDTEISGAEFIRQFEASGPHKGYYGSFNEWLAEQGSLYFTNRGFFTEPEVKSWYQKVAEELKRFYNRFIGKFQTNPDFEAWMDELRVKPVSHARGAAATTESFGDPIRVATEHSRYTTQFVNALPMKATITRKEAQGLLAKMPLPKAEKELVQEVLNQPQFVRERFAREWLVDEINRRVLPLTLTRTLGTHSWTNAEAGTVGNVAYVDNKNTRVITSFDSVLPDRVRREEIRQAAHEGIRQIQFPGETLQDVPISAATEAVEAFSMPIHVGLGHVAKTLGLKGTNYSTIPHATAKINFGLKTALGAFQLLKMNQHVPGAQEYKQALRNSMQYKYEWLSEADAILNEWLDLPPDQTSKLANLMFEEAEQAQVKGQTGFKSTFAPDPKNPNRMVFILDPAEKKRFGLSDKAAEVYSRARSMYRGALDEMERVGISEIMAPEFDPVVGITLREMLRRKAPTADMLTFISQTLAKTQNQVLAAQVQAKIDELRKDFDLMRAKAYMPFSRFGREAILVKDPTSNATLYFKPFETEKELKEELSAVRQRFAGSAISVTRLEDIPYMFQGVPQSFFRAVADKVGIVPGSPEYEAYLQLIKDTTNAASFVRRMKRKQGVEGYSVDAIRGFADYFKRFGNYISRVKRSGELNYSMEVLSDYIKSLESDPRGVHDTRKLRELHEWLAEHKAYIDNPGNELSEVKSLVAMWFFGGNISSAVMNATQVPFVTLPYLSQRFGTARTLKELKRGYTDMARMWKNPNVLSADEQAMWAHALDSGFVDESFATVMAQIADGNAMSRVHPIGKWRRATNAFNHYAMWPFQKAEYINRGVTLLAAYRMNRKAGFNGTFDEAAFNAARGAVEDTQNEYAQEARPTFMRGNWSVIFQFMSFMQNMLFQMLGGDASWKRLLLTQLFLAGALGAPFVEDIKNAVKFLARMWGMDFDPEREARLFLEDMDINSDLILRGMTSNAFGFDLSQRISLGSVIPGMRAVGSNKRFNESVADATGDIAGPGIGVFLNIMRFLAQDDKASLRSLEMIAPSGLRNVIKGVRSEVEGGMKDASGAVLHDPEWWEELGMVVGFMPEKLSDAYTSRTLQQEAANYWTQRRGNLLKEWSYVMLDKDGSREGVADVMEAVREFNANAPDPKLRITLDTLRRTVQERVKANLRREQGLGSSRMTQNLSSEIAQTFQ